MSTDDHNNAPRPDELDDVGIPMKWLNRSRAVATSTSARPGRSEIAFLDSLDAAPRPRRRVLALELQDEDESREAYCPPAPPANATNLPAEPFAGALNAAGSSVAPVAMESEEPVAPRSERRRIVHGTAYAVLAGALCLGALAFYRGGGLERSTWSPDPVKAGATSPVRRVLAAVPSQVLPAVALPPREIEAAPLDLARVDAALQAAWGRARVCLPPQDKGVVVSVHAVLSTSGRVTSAWVEGARYGGTVVGRCIARTIRSTVTAPFEGDALLINRSYVVQ
jgi:hypothetical protein